MSAGDGSEMMVAEADALVNAIVAAVSAKPPREVVLLFGSALTLPETPGCPGVPGARDVVALVKRRFVADVAPSSEAEFDRKVGAAEQPYQAAFQLLIQHQGLDSANRVIREAVLAARRPCVDAERELRERALAATVHEPVCEELSGDIEGWHLRPFLKALAKLVQIAWSRCRRTVLTTNVDPLISVALSARESRYNRSVLYCPETQREPSRRLSMVEVQQPSETRAAPDRTEPCVVIARRGTRPDDATAQPLAIAGGQVSGHHRLGFATPTRGRQQRERCPRLPGPIAAR